MDAEPIAVQELGNAAEYVSLRHADAQTELRVHRVRAEACPLRAACEDHFRWRQQKFENVTVVPVDREEMAFARWQHDAIEIDGRQRITVEKFRIEDRYGIRETTKGQAEMNLAWADTEDFGAPPMLAPQIQIAFLRPAAEVRDQGGLAGARGAGDQNLAAANVGRKIDPSEVLQRFDGPDWQIGHRRRGYRASQWR